MDERKLSRQAIRELAAKNSAALDDCAKAGGNPHQLALDQQDQLDDMADGWGEDEKLEFLNMYVQELNAISSQKEFETQALISKTEQENNNYQIVGGIILAVFVILAFFIF